MSGDSGARRLRVLYATAEAHPTYRPDVRVLFGESLSNHDIDVDLVAVVEGAGPPAPWAAGQAFLQYAPTRMRTMLADLWQQIGLIGRVRNGYDLLVVRDKPVLGVLGWIAARLAGVPYCYWMSYPLPEQYLWLASQHDGRMGPTRRAWL